MTLAVFHDFPGLENGFTKFHDFTGRVVTLTVEGSVSGAISLWFFVYEISREPLNGFAPNSHGRSVVPRSDEFEGQGHQGQKNSIFQPFWRPACSLFGKNFSL